MKKYIFLFSLVAGNAFGMNYDNCSDNLKGTTTSGIMIHGVDSDYKKRKTFRILAHKVNNQAKELPINTSGYIHQITVTNNKFAFWWKCDSLFKIEAYTIDDNCKIEKIGECSNNNPQKTINGIKKDISYELKLDKDAAEETWQKIFKCDDVSIEWEESQSGLHDQLNITFSKNEEKVVIPFIFNENNKAPSI